MMKNVLLLFLFTLFSYSISAQEIIQNKSIVKNVPAIDNVNVFPNPFTYKTKISFVLTTAQDVQFEIKNVLGKTIFHKFILAKEGFNEFLFYRDNLPRGMYLYSIQTEEHIVSKRFVVK